MITVIRNKRDEAKRGINLTTKHTKSHIGIIGNERADELADTGANSSTEVLTIVPPEEWKIVNPQEKYATNMV